MKGLLPSFRMTLLCKRKIRPDSLLKFYNLRFAFLILLFTMLTMSVSLDSVCAYPYFRSVYLDVSIGKVENLLSDISLFTIENDSLKGDTIKKQDKKVSKDMLDAKVNYRADDSTIYDVANQKVFLYNNAQVTYQDIKLKAYYIEFDWGNNIVTATGKTDSVTGKISGEPFFEQGDEAFEAKKIMFNFKTKKGKVSDLLTEQEGGYIHSKVVKKNPDNSYFAKGNAYTTCNYKDHPDFYINASRMKVIPDKVIVSGPANLVIEDIPTPLFVPFAIFPIHKGRASGILFPEYGQRQDLGFFLSNGGYYFAINDYVDLAVRGDIYSRGSWKLNLSSNYKKRYKYGGNIDLNYGNTRTFDINSETPFKPIIRRDFNVRWSYNQDAKSNPKSRFSSSVNFGSSGYNKTYTYSSGDYLNNTFQSSVSYQRSLNDKMNLSLNLDHSQSTQTRVVTLGLPSVSFNVSRITPFKRKISTGTPKWYERISFSYRADAKNYLQSVDSNLFKPGTLNNFSNGFKHSVPINTSFTILKFFNISPSINLNEVMYLKSIRKIWDADSNRVVTDTVKGFAQGFDYNATVSLSTKVYGVVNFKKGKLKAIRHVLMPNMSFNYQPDFSAPKWGYYRSVQTDTFGNTSQYSIFTNGIYGGPPGGKFGGINFGIDNNLEMKVFSKKDSVKQERKIKLLESFAIRSSYNFAVDSFQLTPFTVTARTTIFDKLNLNFSSSFDPYINDSLGRRLNKFEWNENNRPARLTAANLSMGGNLNSKSKSKRTSTGNPDELEMIRNNPDDYIDFNVPWNFSLYYTLSLRKIKVHGDDSLTITQTATMNFDMKVTANWKVTGSLNYDLTNKNFSYSTIELYRDLHCWQMSIRWIPFGARKGYFLTLNVKSAVLQDLKMSKRSSSWGQY